MKLSYRYGITSFSYLNIAAFPDRRTSSNAIEPDAGSSFEFPSDTSAITQREIDSFQVHNIQRDEVAILPRETQPVQFLLQKKEEEITNIHSNCLHMLKLAFRNQLLKLTISTILIKYS